MQRVNRARHRALVGASLGIALAVSLWPGAATAQKAIETVAGMPPVVDPDNLYSETQADKLSPVAARALSRIYVPNRQSNDVYVIDPAAVASPSSPASTREAWRRSTS